VNPLKAYQAPSSEKNFGRLSSRFILVTPATAPDGQTPSSILRRIENDTHPPNVIQQRWIFYLVRQR